MSFADLFDDVLPDSITVEPWTGQDAQGKPTFGAAVLIPHARVVRGKRMFRDATGQDVYAQAVVYAGADLIAIGPKDRVTLPDGTQPPVLGRPLVYPDETGSKVQTVAFA